MNNNTNTTCNSSGCHGVDHDVIDKGQHLEEAGKALSYAIYIYIHVFIIIITVCLQMVVVLVVLVVL